MLLYVLAKEGGIALLEVNPGLVLWTFIVFGIVLFLLHHFAWGPISKALDARADKVHNDIHQAEKLKKEAEEKLSTYLSQLSGLEEEGRQLMEINRKEAEAKRDEILTVAKEEARALVERGNREVFHTKSKALQEVHEHIVNASMIIASQILGRELSGQDHSKLAREVIQKLQSPN